MLKKLKTGLRKTLKGALVSGILMAAGGAAQSQTLTLEQCIDTALQYNRVYRLAQQDEDVADEKLKEVRASLIPKLNATADYRYFTDLPYQLMPASAFGGPAGTYKEVQFGVPKNLNANLQLMVPLFNSAAVSAIKTTAIAGELSEIQKEKSGEEIVMEVSNAYYNAQILLNQLEFLDGNIINTRQLVQTASLMHQEKLVKGTDVDRLQLQLEQLMTQRNTLASRYQQVLNALKFLMGKPISDTISVSTNDIKPVEPEFRTNVTVDILLTGKKIEFVRSELKGLKNSRLPALNAYGVYGTSGFGNTGSDSFFNFHPVGYVGVQLSIPLFNSTVTRHRINQKKIDLNKAIIQKELTTEKSRLDVNNAAMQYSLTRETIGTARSQVQLASRIYENTVLQHSQGTASITDLLLADNALREAQQNYIVALIELRKAELEYKRVTGNLINPKYKQS